MKISHISCPPAQTEHLPALPSAKRDLLGVTKDGDGIISLGTITIKATACVYHVRSYWDNNNTVLPATVMTGYSGKSGQ